MQKHMQLLFTVYAYKLTNVTRIIDVYLFLDCTSTFSFTPAHLHHSVCNCQLHNILILSFICHLSTFAALLLHFNERCLFQLFSSTYVEYFRNCIWWVTVHSTWLFFFNIHTPSHPLPTGVEDCGSEINYLCSQYLAGKWSTASVPKATQ